MSYFKTIQQKLHDFIQKYYTNEIIKGSILFISFGLLYFIFTLFIEYFLWLDPTYRTILFWLFIIVETGLLTKFIFIPAAKLFGLRKGISKEEASQIIGKYFKEVDDKLLNVLQLHNDKDQSELLLASIEQKASEIQPVPFKKAINFKANKKYLKYLSIPLFIWLFTYFSGNNSVFTQSLDRVVHHQKFYQPPAPFHFKVLNDYFEVIEGKDFELNIEVVGDVIPEDVKVVYNGETYLLKKAKNNRFSHRFESLTESLSFSLEANGVFSSTYNILVIPTPDILDFEMHLEYPNYTLKPNAIIKNTGNITVPEGTEITWQIKTKDTDKVIFKYKDKESVFEKDNKSFTFKKKVKNNLNYQISSSNEQLSNYEKLNFQINVLKDEFPHIQIRSDIDSISRGDAHFLGQISDDYGISNLNAVYSEIDSDKVTVVNIPVQNNSFQDFFFIFPYKLELQEGKIYEIYFQVFDNDRVNGKKSTNSKKFYYNNKTYKQISRELLQEQKQILDDLQNEKETIDDLNKDMKDFNQKLKSKSEFDWNDKKQLNQYLKRQNQYQKMMQKDADKILKNLNEIEVDKNNQNLNEKKEELQKRIAELNEIQKNEKLLDELQKLSKKLKKEGLLDKLDKLTEKTKQQNRSLERLLELTKRFYVEKKANEISKNLDSLAKKQEQLSNNSSENNLKNQKELEKQFDSIQKDLNNLRKENSDLKSPMPIPNTESEEKSVKDEMQKASENLKNEENYNKSKSKSSASQSQKSAAKKINKISRQMKSAMQQMSADMVEENIEDLQQILDNLLTFSFDQEDLLKSFESTDERSLDLPDKLKKQQVLKDYFEHIDDSLYTLSMRLVRISSKIENELTEVHYNIDKSLENLSESKIIQGVKNQHYTLTAANNLADLLSNVLQSLQNPKKGSGQGKGKKGESISLPDIIKKQEDLLGKMKQGIKQGNKKGEQSNEQLSGEQYEIFKEQHAIKEALQELINRKGANNLKSNSVQNQMEQLEQLLLQKGFNQQVYQQMQNLHHELLKLEKSFYDKGKNEKRKSKAGYIESPKKYIDQIDSKRIFFDQDDLLIRKPLPLQPYYQKKVTDFFKINTDD
ncbi:MAG: DUF4175 family protein [Bacteroidota bacterium]